MSSAKTVTTSSGSLSASITVLAVVVILKEPAGATGSLTKPERSCLLFCSKTSAVRGAPFSRSAAAFSLISAASAITSSTASLYTASVIADSSGPSFNLLLTLAAKVAIAGMPPPINPPKTEACIVLAILSPKEMFSFKTF